MSAALPLTLRVGAHTWTLEFSGFDQPLRAIDSEGQARVLAPWTLGEHLDALGRCCRAAPEGLTLDAACYAAEVLGDPGEVPRFGAVALWWATGGEGAATPPQSVRTWTFLERAAATRACTHPQTGAFDLAAWLGRALDTCAPPEQGPPGAWRGRPAAEGIGLLRGLAETLAPAPLVPEPAEDPGTRALTLRLCRALGWTPAQVWTTPAPEIDRLLALLGPEAPLAAPAPGPAPNPANPPTSRLAAWPDAVVIQVEDE